MSFEGFLKNLSKTDIDAWWRSLDRRQLAIVMVFSWANTRMAEEKVLESAIGPIEEEHIKNMRKDFGEQCRMLRINGIRLNFALQSIADKVTREMIEADRS